MKNFKKGDKVVMHTCHESTLPQYEGKVWTCEGDSYVMKGYEKQEVVFLEGFGGCFSCEYLQIVKQEKQWISVKEKMPKEEGFYLVIVDESVGSKKRGNIEISDCYKTVYSDNDKDLRCGIKFQDYVTHWMPLPETTE
jgi:hypothetical protein